MIARLAQQVRSKTTSEHLLELRGLGNSVKPIKKSQKRLAMENLSHMNCMPVPRGSWQDCYQAVNMKRNRNLILSSSALAITIYCMLLADCFYLHSAPSRSEFLPNREKVGKLNRSDVDRGYERRAVIRRAPPREEPPSKAETPSEETPSEGTSSEEASSDGSE